jgi:methionyl aminopeptidase
MTNVIEHSGWKFEYNKSKNIYNIDTDTLENHILKHNNSLSFNCGIDTEEITEEDLENFRKGGIVHRIVRNKARELIGIGLPMNNLVKEVEELTLKLTNQNKEKYYYKGGDNGIAFPVGINLNNVIAHDTVMKCDDYRKFYKGDVAKIDIGVHFNGYIIDSAFTHIVGNEQGVNDGENIYNEVLNASKESVYSAIVMSGPDQRLIELSEIIDEIINSYEVNLGKEILHVVPVKGIGGHNILRNQIHGGKLILSSPDKSIQGDDRMEEGEIFAIETYASTGSGNMTQNGDLGDITHFMEAGENKATKKEIKYFVKTDLYKWMKTRNGLPFSSDWLNNLHEEGNFNKLNKSMKIGIDSGQIMAYPPLNDMKNSVVAQFEHTIHVKDGGVEIFSIGNDY